MPKCSKCDKKSCVCCIPPCEETVIHGQCVAQTVPTVAGTQVLFYKLGNVVYVQFPSGIADGDVILNLPLLYRPTINSSGSVFAFNFPASALATVTDMNVLTYNVATNVLTFGTFNGSATAVASAVSWLTPTSFPF